MNPTLQQPTQPQISNPSQFGQYSDWAKQQMGQGVSAQSLLSNLQSRGDKINQPSQGNWFTRLLPTLGMVGGGILGEAIDPFGGGLIGASLLSGLGGATGQAVQNAASGQSALQGNDLTSGLMGAIGTGAGGLLAKGLGGAVLDKAGNAVLDSGGNPVVGGLAGKLNNFADNQIAKTGVAEGAAQDAANTQALNGEFGTLGQNFRNVNNFGDSINKLNALGLPQTAQGMVDASTANDPLNGLLTDALSQRGAVDTGGFNKVINDAVNSEKSVLGDTAPISTGNGLPVAPNNLATQLKSKLNGYLQNSIDTANGAETKPLTNNSLPESFVKGPQIGEDQNGQPLFDSSQPSTKIDPSSLGYITQGQVDPLAFRQVSQQIGADLGNAKTVLAKATEAGNPEAIKQAQSEVNVLKQVYDSSKSTLYDHPAVNDFIKNANGADYVAPKGLPASDNPAIANDVSNTITNAKNAQDILTPMQTNTNMGNIGKQALLDQKNGIATNRAVTLTNRSAKGASEDTAPTSTNALKTGGALLASVGHPAGLVANVLSHTVENPTILKTIAKVLGSGAVQKGLPIAGEIAGGSPSVATSAQNNVSSNQTGNNNMQGNPNISNPYAIPLQAYENAAQYAPGLIGQLYPNGGQPLIQGYQGYNIANNSLNGALSNYNAAGGAQGPVQGLLSQLGSIFTGGPASTYGQSENTAAQAIAHATGLPVQEIQQLMPSITQNQSGANQNIQTILSMIQGMGMPSTVGG